MAVKDIKEYYAQVESQYNEMIKEIKDFEKEAEQGLIEPERLDQIKEGIKPLMNNYQTLSWIMFLLNAPNRKSKRAKYERQTRRLQLSLDDSKSKDAIIKENKATLNNLKSIISK